MALNLNDMTNLCRSEGERCESGYMWYFCWVIFVNILALAEVGSLPGDFLVCLSTLEAAFYALAGQGESKLLFVCLF